MSVYVITQVMVTCEGCSNAIDFDYMTKAAAWKKAKEMGWKRIGGKEFCSGCINGGRHLNAFEKSALHLHTEEPPR